VLAMSYTVKRVSPSQISTFRRCAARWWWQYPQGIKPPPSPAAKLGSDVHKVLEDYQQHGTPPDLTTEAGQIAAVAVPYISPGDPLVQIERSFQMASGCGPILIGRIDVLRTGSARLDIRDWKTTSDFRYCRTEAELTADPQAVIYSASQEGKHGEERIEFQHFYLRTKPPYKERLVSVEMDRDTIRKGLDGVRDTIGQMQQAASATEPNGLESLDACNDFGGCPHRQRCALKGIQSMGPVSGLFAAGATGAKSMNGIDDFFAAIGGAKKPEPQNYTPGHKLPTEGVSAAPQLINPPDGVAQTEPLTLADVQEMEQKPESKAKLLIFDGRETKQIKAAEMAEIHGVYLSGIQAAGQLASYKQISTWDRESQKRKDLKPDLELMISLLPDDWKPTPQRAEEDQPQASDLAGLAQRTAGTATPAPAPAVQTPPAPVAQPVEPQAGADSLVLYIDCTPGAGAVHLEDWPTFRRLCQQAADAKGVGYYAALPYREGERMVADGLARLLADGRADLPAELVMITRGREGERAHLLEVLRPVAHRVVIGVMG